MNLFQNTYHFIESLGIHRYGLLFISAVLIVPAIISGNITLFYLREMIVGERTAKNVQSFLINFTATFICAVIFMWTLVEYI